MNSLEGLEKNLAVGEEAICTKFNEFRTAAIEDLKKIGVERSISCDLDKLLHVFSFAVIKYPLTFVVVLLRGYYE